MKLIVQSRESGELYMKMHDTVTNKTAHGVTMGSARDLLRELHRATSIPMLDGYLIDLMERRGINRIPYTV